MKKLSAWFATFLFCFIFWLLLVPSFELKEVITGMLAAAVIAAVTERLLIHESPFYLYNPVRLVAFVIYYVFIFFYELLKANLMMTKIVFWGDKNLKQGIIRIPAASVHSAYGKQLVANSITLTPGTLTVDVAGDEEGNDYYYVQWIDVKESDRVKAGEMIKGRMERWIGRIWK